jgi:putative SbcD/Mre11-related phosphoesterase
MYKVLPLNLEPVLLIDGKLNKQHSKFIVASDLHIGSETFGNMNGVILSSKVHIENISERFQKLVDLTKADGIILLGDLKSSISKITQLELDIIPAILASISQYAEVYLIPGNHDSYMKYVTPDNVNLISSGGMVLGDILLIHGHTMPTSFRSSIRKIIMGHIHPIFLRPNNIVSGQRIWIHMKVRKQAVFSDGIGHLEIIIMPTFHESHNAPLRYNLWRSMPPIIERIIKCRAIEEMQLLTLDGAIVADLSCLEGDIPYRSPGKDDLS